MSKPKVWKCPYHKDEYFDTAVLLAKHIDDVIEKEYGVSFPPIMSSTPKTEPENVPARDKKKKKRAYSPNLEEVNMGAAGPSAFDGSDAVANIGGYQDFRTRNNYTIDDTTRRIMRDKKVPKKKKVWTRHYGGAPSYPRPSWGNTPEIMAIKGKIEEYVDSFYEKIMDAVMKGLQPIDTDIKLRDEMVQWLYELLKKEIAIMGVENALSLAEELQYLNNFREKIIRKQIEKRYYLLHVNKE